MPKRVRLGVLGGAGIAKAALFPAIGAARNAELVAVGTRDPERARQSLDLGSDVRLVSYESLIGDPNIDAIYVPLPNALHAEWSLKAAEAGKAVLCEKPLALDAAEAERLATRCAALGTPLMEGFMYRSHPQHERVRQILDAREIGDVTEVRAHLAVNIMDPPDAANVRFQPELGGGALLDMGCYTVSICRFILEEEPVAVTCSWQIDPRFNVDVSAAGILEFAGGRTGVVSCSFLGNSQGSYSVVGRRGVIEVPRGIIPGLGSRLGETLVIIADGDGRRREELIEPVDQYRLMIESFSDAVLGQRPIPIHPDDSVRNMRVLDALALSAREARRVVI